MKRAPGVLLSRPVTSILGLEAPQGTEEVAQEPPESGGGVERDILRIGRRLYPAGSPSTSTSKYSLSLYGPTTDSTSSFTASTDSPCQMHIPVVCSGVAALIGSEKPSGRPVSKAFCSAASKPSGSEMRRITPTYMCILSFLPCSPMRVRRWRVRVRA